MYVTFISFGFILFLGFILISVCSGGVSLLISFFPSSFFLNNFIEFIICVDSVVLSCLIMLLVCSLLAFIYCFHYYYGSLGALSLFYLMVWFVSTMLLLVVSGSLVFTLVMWEYLGFVSFLLILFYSNSSSVRASLVTLFSSRFGDVGLFVVIACWLCGFNVTGWLFFFCFFLVIITKSAGFPFISWLLEAMRAPTPVSSLVHSSTLVAAGVWFMVRYGVLLDSYTLFFVFVFSVITIYITGICALFFLDLKKIVALSTCNNIAWCLLYYTCGDVYLVIFQLLVHGVCKCALFILVGDLMSSSGSSQSSMGVYMSRYGGVYGNILLVFLVFCLCGVPFLGIYFSKHFFFMCLVGGVYNIFLVLSTLLGFFFSYLYSFRLALMVCSGVRGLSLGYLVSFIFVSLFVLIGTFFGWLICGGFEEYNYLSFIWSFFFLLIQFFGCFFGYLIYTSNFVGWFWNTILCGSDSLVNLFYFFYYNVFGLSLIGVYRWELSVFSLLGRFSGVFMNKGLFIFSLNFMILGILFYSLFCGLI
uniref:NADH:ubiquinone reductase (H(+)-translocating) n=1 Tax=Cotylurus marcogliesei TaxID=2282156 RepID=A0A6J3YML4_9TREM|nr:NADH dehydrogenase subunit 5 [Cotylurus marcogliesei]